MVASVSHEMFIPNVDFLLSTDFLFMAFHSQVTGLWLKDGRTVRRPLENQLMIGIRYT